MDFLLTGVLSLFLLRSIRNILYQTFLWQLKEYRWDRFVSHLHTELGKRFLWGYSTTFKWILFLLLLFFTFVSRQYQLYVSVHLLFWLVWLGETILFLREFVSRGWKVPIFTARSTVLLFFGIFFFVSPFLILGTGSVVSLAPYLDKFQGLFLFFLVRLTSFPSFVFRMWVRHRALRKLRLFGGITVVGITGSFGKTSTKEYVATILGESFQVLRSPDHVNTEIGVARTILHSLQKKHKIFVVEMGAYTRGEIRSICRLVSPTVSILTGIGTQHYALFGSQQNLVAAKYEIFEFLPKTGFAVLSGSDEYSKSFTSRLKKDGKNVVCPSVSSEVKHLRRFPDHIEFSYIDGKTLYPLSVPLLSPLHIPNLLAAIHTAKVLGMGMDDIVRGVARISPDIGVKIRRYNEHVTCIDDSFSGNEQGIGVAVDTMRVYSGVRILVFTPLIELGEIAEDVHQRIGSMVSRSCDHILVTNITHYSSLLRGVLRAQDVKKFSVVSPSSFLSLVSSIRKPQSVIYFSGRESRRFLRALFHEWHSSRSDFSG